MYILQSMEYGQQALVLFTLTQWLKIKKLNCFQGPMYSSFPTNCTNSFLPNSQTCQRTQWTNQHHSHHSLKENKTKQNKNLTKKEAMESALYIVAFNQGFNQNCQEPVASQNKAKNPHRFGPHTWSTKNALVGNYSIGTDKIPPSYFDAPVIRNPLD